MKRMRFLIFAAAVLILSAGAYVQVKGTFAGSGPINITDQEFQREVLSSQTPVVVEFWSPKCSHCLKMAKTVDDMAAGLAGSVKVVKVNVLDNKKAAKANDVHIVPTFLLFKDGKKTAQALGEMSEKELKAELGI